MQGGGAQAGVLREQEADRGDKETDGGQGGQTERDYQEGGDGVGEGVELSEGDQRGTVDEETEGDRTDA